ncbi:cupin domain-containing protein [Nannocystis pusilla]|uniref:Cupin domain-containing protein n=1 Tax=Nannocystis pusilla TaxID=889268 RepID=A0ABS7TNA0_9BACT|nr:cupin domain-containing protein [Nannocystis pusilla]MBZ5709703.1 cupin domain-containing protein [Nannocystis pusilla]
MSRAGFVLLFSIVATTGCERAPEPVKVETRSELAKAEPGKKKDTKGETRAEDARPADAPKPSLPAAVTSLAQAEHRQKSGGAAQIWALARGQNAFLGKLEMAPGGTVPEHRDPTEEYIHILSGAGKFTIDGQSHEVGPGTTIYMPPGALVSFENGPEPLVAIQVFAGPEPAAKYDAWERVPSSP